MFDDWSLLRQSVASVADRVDEIVVVDGAYTWLAPYFAAIGRDPARSDERVREALAPFAAKLRWIEGVWDNEPHKRATGFAACTGRHVFRIDADEVLFFDEAQLAAYFAGSRPIAEMEMPIYVAPGLIRRRAERVERQCMIFDRDRIGAREHLAYLWLVLPPEERAALGKPDSWLIHADPVAFCAHLTHWRMPASAVNRARFYILNSLREGHAVRWAPSFCYADGRGLAPLLESVPPEVLDDIWLGTRIVAGAPDIAGWHLAPTPLNPAQEAVFADSYKAFLAGLAALNAGLAGRPRALMSEEAAMFDVSTPAAAAPFARPLQFSEPISAAGAGLHEMLAEPPWERRQPLPVASDGRTIQVRLPPPDGALRRTLVLAARATSGVQWVHMSAGAA